MQVKLLKTTKTVIISLIIEMLIVYEEPTFRPLMLEWYQMINYTLLAIIIIANVNCVLGCWSTN